MDEERELDEQEAEELNRQIKQQEENTATHIATQRRNVYINNSKRAMGYNTARRTDYGHRADSTTRRGIQKNQFANKIARGIRKGKSLSGIGKSSGAASGGASVAGQSPEMSLADKAKVTIKIAKISFPIVTVLIIVLPIVFLLIFVSVILTSLDFFDDISSQSGHTSYLASVNSNCNSLSVDGASIALEDYVANVVANEIGNNASYEKKKALAVVVRTNVIKTTSTCRIPVPSVNNDFQIYNKNTTPNQDTINAVQETKSQIVFMNNKMPTTDRDDFTVIKNSDKKYQDILKEIYGDEVEIEAFTQADGLEVTGNPNYFARTVRATKENQYYYNPTTGFAVNGLEGECAWYGLCRAKEILGTSGSSKTFPRGGNGGQFCEVAAGFDDPFTIVKDVNKPKEGSLIVWKGGIGNYGHVAVIEKIIDSNTVFLSEASITNGKFGRTATDLLWTNGSRYNITISNYGSIENARHANCEGNNSGCQSFKEIPISSLANYSGLNFECYVYLLDN